MSNCNIKKCCHNCKYGNKALEGSECSKCDDEYSCFVPDISSEDLSTLNISCKSLTTKERLTNALDKLKLENIQVRRQIDDMKKSSLNVDRTVQRIEEEMDLFFDTAIEDVKHMGVEK